MNIEQILAAHERETDKLIAEIKAYRARPRESCDYMIYDGFAAQVKSFKNLGVRLTAVDEADPGQDADSQFFTDHEGDLWLVN